MFEEGSHSALVEILIHHDLLDEDEENFTAELQTDSQNTSTTIIILDTVTVLCSFDKPEYHVYESVGNFSLGLNSSRAIPVGLVYKVQVDTIYGTGNASGELHIVYDKELFYTVYITLTIWLCCSWL